MNLDTVRRYAPLLALTALVGGAPPLLAQQDDPAIPIFKGQLAGAKVLQVGAGWRLVDTDPEGLTGEDPMVWQFQPESIDSLPVTDIEKDYLHAALENDTDDPSDNKDATIFASQTHLLADAENHQSEIHTKGLCDGWSRHSKSGAWDFNESLLNRNFPFDNGIAGHLQLDLPASGHVNYVFNYRSFSCLGPPSLFEFRNVTANGNVSLNGAGSLQASVSVNQHWEKEWLISETHLGSAAFWVGPVYVYIDFTLPIYVGASFDATVTGAVAAQFNATGGGTFDYVCTSSNCTGSNNFQNNFSFNETTSSASIDLKARAWARVMAAAALYNSGILYVEGGAEAHAQARLFGYIGNSCGDADGDGQNESVEGLLADLGWGYRFAWATGGLILPDRVHYFGGNDYIPLAFRDLLGGSGSTVLQPMLVGPANPVVGMPANYTVRMRPCYPFKDKVNFTLTPGTWTGPTQTPTPPGSAAVSTTFPSLGAQTIVVNATTDTGGRDIYMHSSRTLTVTPDIPLSPSNLVASIASPTSVSLTWSDNSSNEDGFDIQRRTLPSGSFQSVASAPASATSASDVNVVPGLAYEYVVRAMKQGYGSPVSNASQVTLPQIAPATPNGLVITLLSTSSARLAWTDHSNNESQFDIYRHVAPSGVYSVVASVGANVVTFTDTGLASGTTYEYRVRAVNSAGASPLSNPASVTTSATIPAAPTSLVASVLSPTSVQLNWNDTSNNETSFELQRRLSPSGTFVVVATLGANTVTASDTSVAQGTAYDYRVRATNVAGSSAFTPIATVTTTIPTPAAPTGLIATYNTTTRIVTLTWSDNSNNEQGFNVQFSYSGSAFSDMAFTAPNVTSFSTGANPPTGSYQFRVRSYIGSNASAFVNTSLIVSNPSPTTSIAWIQTAETAWGPAGTLTAAGYAANGTGGVQLVWRERSSAGVWGAWTTVAYQAPPVADTSWSNTISSGSPTNKCHWFDAYTNYSGVTSAVFHYTGAPGCQ